MIAYISIGNSDDKLSQMQWGKFYRKVDLVLQDVRRVGGQVHGRWTSEGSDYWQNACWCIELPDNPQYIDGLKDDLAILAETFGQDAIAWAEVLDTEFLSKKE